jgi:hypothetical protein
MCNFRRNTSAENFHHKVGSQYFGRDRCGSVQTHPSCFLRHQYFVSLFLSCKYIHLVSWFEFLGW